MKKQKRQAERMPRKMKKRYKKLMAFYGERRMEYDLIKNLAVFAAAFIKDIKAAEDRTPDEMLKSYILEKCKTMEIFPEDIEKITVNDKLQTATITLKSAARFVTMFLEVDGGLENADNN